MHALLHLHLLFTMTTGNYFVVCTHVGKPCGISNHTDRTTEATTINHQMTDRSGSYQTGHNVMLAASSTTDVTMTTSHTQSVDTVAMATSPITNNTTTNSVRVNNTITSNGSSVSNCTVSISAAATNSIASIDSMTNGTDSTIPNSSATTHPQLTSKRQTFNVCFVGCTTAQSSSMPACIFVCLCDIWCYH